MSKKEFLKTNRVGRVGGAEPGEGVPRRDKYMTLFLRTKNNRTVVDVECWTEDDVVDISVSVDIAEYSKLLLALPTARQQQAIASFDQLTELRGWLHEVFYPGEDERLPVDQQFTKVLAFLRELLDSVGKEYGLGRVED